MERLLLVVLGVCAVGALICTLPFWVALFVVIIGILDGIL